MVVYHHLAVAGLAVFLVPLAFLTDSRVGIPSPIYNNSRMNNRISNSNELSVTYGLRYDTFTLSDFTRRLVPIDSV